MYVKDFKRYLDSRDLTKVPVDCLAYPSKNCIIYKGVVHRRLGIANDGNDPTEDSPVIGEYVWKDQVGGGIRPLKAWNTSLQMKYNDKWITIYTGIDANAENVRFARWLDSTGSIIKKRLYFVDGSDSIHEWNGAIATVSSVAGQDITISGVKTLLQLGFDAGTAVAITIVKFDGNGDYVSQSNYTYTDDCTDQILHIDTAISPSLTAGDLIIATPIEHTSTLSGVLKDDLYTYKNHLGIGSIQSNAVYFSSIETPLDYTVPVPASRTAISPFTIYLTGGNYTAMISRKDVLWISTADSWIKVTKTEQQNSYDEWVTIEDFEQPENNGALPFAVTKYKTDVIYMAQDKRLRRITTLELTGKDDTILLSDDIENLLLRLDTDNCRLYYLSRYIYICLPRESTLLMLDMVGDVDMGLAMFWQPPQTIPISHISIIDNVQYGHSNTNNETFEFFTGGDDLGSPISTMIASGLHGSSDRHDQIKHQRLGIDGRITTATDVTIIQKFEAEGKTAKFPTVIDGSKMKLFDVLDDVSYAMVPWATRSWAGADMEQVPYKRFFVFDTFDMVSWFEHQLLLEIEGKDKDFQLIGWSLDNQKSDQKVDSALFVQKTI